jgi:uncharacterized OsmC-like protein
MDLITVTRGAGTAFEVRIRDRCVVCDMAPQDGGHGAGFTPAELVGAALGACIGIMVQGYCDACAPGAGDVEASLTVELADEPHRIGAFVVDVELPEGIPEVRKEAVRRVIEKCVIHETLRNPPEVDVDIQFN